jgi:hypothetical protein
MVTYSHINIKAKKIKNIYMEINANIIAMRRLFPDRKWHKINDKVLTEIEVDNLLNKCECYIIDAINLGFIAIMNTYNNYNYPKKLKLTNDDIVDMIYTKHNKMMNSLI